MRLLLRAAGEQEEFRRVFAFRAQAGLPSVPMSKIVYFLGHGFSPRLSIRGEKLANVLLLACCYQEVSVPPAADLLAGAPAVVPPFWVTGAPSPCMRAHTRLMAVLRSVNFFTGVTPGRLFPKARSLSPDHWAARSASSCWLAK